MLMVKSKSIRLLWELNHIFMKKFKKIIVLTTNNQQPFSVTNLYLQFSYKLQKVSIGKSFIHILLSYFKSLRVGPAGVLTYDLSLCKPALIQLS